MSKIHSSVLSLIGNTPLVEIKNIDTGLCRLFVKMESDNPGGSIKDRVASYIINQAEKEGKLKPGGTIIEATAGNTGIGLALVGILKGYKVLLVIPDKMSLEKIAHLKALGAEIKFTRSDVGKDHPEYYHNIAEGYVKSIPGAFYADQFNNPANIMAHEETTAPEIYEQMDGDLDAFVAGVGSGGTLTGVGRFLQKVSPKTNIVAADPVGSIIKDAVKTGTFNYDGGSWLVEGIGEDYIPTNCDLNVITDAISVSDKEAFEAIQLLLKKEGILAGSSAGTLFAAALKWCKEQKEQKKVVTLICDTGNKYLSKAFNGKWLAQNDLVNFNPKGTLEDVLVSRFDMNEVIYVKPDDSLLVAFNRMNDSDISQLPVLDKENLVGIITEDDVLNNCSNGHGFDKKISETMQKNFKNLNVDDSLDQLVDYFKTNSLAIILEDKKFIGIITKIDLLAYLKRTNING